MSREFPVPLKRVNHVRYTQSSCSCVFRDGRSLEQSVADLVDGRVDALRDEWLTLDVVLLNGKLYSVNNRRLYCLKQFQILVRHSCTVLVRVRLHRWNSISQGHICKQFRKHFTTECDGESIFIRMKPAALCVSQLHC